MKRSGVVLAVLATFVATARAEPYAPGQIADHDPSACRERDVVVHRRCPRFGIWGDALEAPYITVFLGVTMRTIPRALGASQDPGLAERATQAPDATARDTSYEYTERLAVAVAGPLYLGGEVDLGISGAYDRPPGARTPAVTGAGFAGLQLDRGTLALGGELAAGGRFVEVATRTTPRCEGEVVVEARARAGLWLTPWLTVDAALGTSLIDRGEWSAGLYLGIHSRAFGGSR